MVNKMGLETIAIIGLSLFQANSKLKQSEKQQNQLADQAARDQEAIIDQGNLDAANKSKEVRLRAARTQLSFLNSGLTLEGTPMAAINETFAVGLDDINQINKNSSTRAKNVGTAAQNSINNIASSTRTEVLGDLAGTAIGSFGGGDIFGTNNALGSQGSVSRSIEFGSSSVQGPIQGFGGFGG